MQLPPEHEMLEIVDENNRVTGIRDRAEIHRQGLWHRSVHIFIFNSQGGNLPSETIPSKRPIPGTLGFFGRRPSEPRREPGNRRPSGTGVRNWGLIPN